MQKKTKPYDVIIVGAGPAGLMLAHLLRGSSLNVALIEGRPTIRKMLNHRYGTFQETVEKFNLEKYVIARYGTFGWYYKQKRIAFKYTDKPFAVVDMNGFAQKVKLSCDLHTNVVITKAKRIKNGLQITGENNQRYTAKIVVDCSGSSRVLARTLGYFPKNSTDFFSTSYEIKNANIPIKVMDEIAFMADFRFGNAACWFYPYSTKECQIGHTEFIAKKFHLPSKQSGTLKAYIAHTAPYKTWLNNGVITEQLRKIGPTATINRTLVDDHMLACGDAAGAGTPVIGEGFRIALGMANQAHQVIEKAFEKNDFSRQSLSSYERWFNRWIGKYYWASKLLRFVGTRYTTEKEYKIFLHNLKKLTNEEFMTFVRSEITFLLLLKILRFKLAIKVIVNAFKHHIFRRSILPPRLTS